MSKQSKGSPVGNVGWGSGYVLCFNFPDVLNGKIYEILEAAGLPQKQEESIKRLIQKTVWEEVGYGVYITAERHKAIREEWEKAKLAGAGCRNPHSSI